MQQPRDHHFFFAKKMIPTHTFQSTDMMFRELTGPQREAFVFWLWNEAGKGMQALPHVAPAPDGRSLAKLEVVGRIDQGGAEVIVISMPPALAPNEAMFLALVRRPAGVSVFFWERCVDMNTGGVSPTDAVLAEVRSDGMRINHGFHTGLDLAAFKGKLGEVLGISLAGLEASLPEITAEAFVKAGGGRGARQGGGGEGGAKKGSTFETLLLVRAGLPVAMFVLWRVLASLAAPISLYVWYVNSALSVVLVIMLLVWLYRVHDARRGQASFSPGMAVGGWLIPGANLVLPPLILRSAWKATVGAGGGLLALVWWLSWLVEMVLQMMRSLKVGFVVDPGRQAMVFEGGSIALPDGVASVLTTIYSPTGGLLAALGAYGLLWYVVKSVNARL